MAPPNFDQKFATFAAQDAAAQKAHAAVEAIQAKATAISSRNDEQSPLLKLPGELRNRIYRYVVIEDDPIHLEVGYSCMRPRLRLCSREYKPRPTKTVPVALWSTCRKLHREVHSIFATENSFCLSNRWTGQRLHPGHVDELRLILGDNAKDVTRVGILRSISARKVVRVDPESVWQQFTASLAGDKVMIAEEAFGSYAACYCVVRDVAGTYSEQSNISVLGFIAVYADWASAEDGGERPGVCPACDGYRPHLRAGK